MRDLFSKTIYFQKMIYFWIIIFFALFITQNNMLKVNADNVEDYEYTVENNEVEITNYTGSKKTISIPDTLGGKSVVRIGHGAFFRKQLTKVTIPDSVKEIGMTAFESNELTHITIPDSVTKVEPYAFTVNQLESVDLGSNLEEIHGSSFGKNPLKTIKVNKDNDNYVDIDEKGLYTKNGEELIVGTTSGEIGGAIKNIAAHSFRGRGVKSIKIPESVVEIGEYAFDENKLTILVIPNNVKNINNSAFRNNDLETLEIGDSISSIGLSAFRLNKLKVVKIPDSVQNIGNFAFSYNKIESVFLGKNIEMFSGIAFTGNPLDKIDISEENSNFKLAEGGKALYSTLKERIILGTTSGKIEDGTNVIGEFAFDGRGLNNIIIPDSVTEIDSSAFSNNELSSIDIPKGVKNIYSLAFSNNELTSINILENVEKINPDAFSDNPLEKITVDKNNSKYKDLDKKGLYYKDKNELVLGTISGYIASDTEIIGHNAFQGRGLEGHLIIPNSVTKIASGAFYSNQLEYVTIPSNVIEIESNAFSANDELVILGEKGTKAEEYANNYNIPFLSTDKPIVFFEPDGSNHIWKRDASVRVNAYGLSELELKYAWSNSDVCSDIQNEEWNSFVNGEEIVSDKEGKQYLHIYAEDTQGTTICRSSKAFFIKDQTEPSITLNGHNPLTLEIGQAYEEPNATAIDNVDGNISDEINITGKVNTNKPGIYYVYYNVTDSAGNKAQEKIREVHVIPPEVMELELDKQPMPVYAGTEVNIKNTHTSLTLSKDLPEGTMLQVSSVKDLSWKEYVETGEMYDFNLIFPEGFENYKGEFILTLSISKDEEKSAIYYYNENSKQLEYIGGQVSNGKITAEIEHFSIYGVFAQNEEDHSGKNVTNDKITDIKVNNELNDDNKMANVTIDKLSNEGNAQKLKDNTIPKTATNRYNIIAIGFVLMFLGGISFIFIRKKTL